MRFLVRWLVMTRVLTLALQVEYLVRTRTFPDMCKALSLSLSDDLRVTTGLIRLTPSEIRSLRCAELLMRHWPWDDTCLRRSLVHARLLRHRGAHVRLGVRRTSGQLRAHAWVEGAGLPIDPEAAGFFPLPESRS
jgi:hypothetical protein